MKLYTKIIRLKKTALFSSLVVLPILCVYVIGTVALKPQAQATNLSEDVLEFYSLSDIFFYDPSCIVSGDGTLCGDTAVERYWSAISKYVDDPIKIAGIIGNIAWEGGFNPVSWQVKDSLSDGGINSSGNFAVGNFDWYLNNNSRTTGVGSFQITSDLGVYLQYIKKNAPDLIKYFENPSEYSYNYYYHPGLSGYDVMTNNYGDMLLKKIGDAEFDKLVEWEVKFAMEDGPIYGARTQNYKNQSISSPEDAAGWWARNWEICYACADEGSSTRRERNYFAGEAYNELKNFSCVGGSSSGSSSSDPLSKEITLIGDSIGNASKEQLQEKFPGSFFTVVDSRFSSRSGSLCSGDPGGLETLQILATGSGTVITGPEGGSCKTLTVDGSSLKDNIVWELGTNDGVVNRSTIENVISIIGNNRNLFLVTPYDGNNMSAADETAKMYRGVADEYDNVYVVDWNEAVRGNESKYITRADGLAVHPTEEGKKLLAELIDEAIDGAQSCDINIDSSGYRERLKNLYKFNQGSGTWASYQMCNGKGNKISRSGCGIMSLYAAYYMFTGHNLDDQSFYTNLITATEEDGYNSCNGTSESGYGSKSEDLTGIKMEKLWGCDSDDCYSDAYWDVIVKELQKGNKIILGTAGPNSSGGRSIFAQRYHASFLDHYDAATDRVYRFDPIYDRCSYEGIDCDSDDYRNGHYVTREAMDRYVRPYSGWAMIYKDNSCYNICEPEGGSETTPIYPLDEDSVDVACAKGTTDMGTYDNPSWKGKSLSIRLCKVDNLTSTGQDDPGFAIVNSRVSGAFRALAERAQSEGVDLIASSSFRTYERQYQFCYTYGWCSIGRAAAPGNSMHELGLAVDFNGTCEFGVSPASCDATGNRISLWLRDNIEDFELYRPLSNEAWHVQPLLNGGK